MSKRGKPKPELIAALGYFRKSTKGMKADGRQRQEKSIGQQKAEVEKLTDDRFRIVGWFQDEGVSGWKRGIARPDFDRMLRQSKELGAQAIVCDNLDRFSRAAVDEVQEDANTLRKAGVRWIVTASHGTYDLGARYDIGEILRFVVAVWSNCEYSRQLGRRVTLARRNRALDGLRSGGSVAYGMADDGKAGLKPGDPKEVKIVKWLFDGLGNEFKSMHSMAKDLNGRGVLSPNGKMWTVKTIRDLLRRKCYRGDFAFNVGHSGQFFGIDDKGEVVETSELNGTRKVFRKEGVYKALIQPALFDKVQRRLDLLSRDRGRRKAMYALSDILRCGHCNAPLHGVSMNDGRIYYRCSSPPKNGSACGRQQVREDRLLPFLMKLLGEEITNLRELLTDPPDELRSPNKARSERREQAQQDRDKLAAQIAKAEDNLLLSPDHRTFLALDIRLSAMRDELDKLDAELTEEQPNTITVDGKQIVTYSREELDALTSWWDDFNGKAVSVPLHGKGYEAYRSLHTIIANSYQDPSSDEAAVLLDPRRINAALHELGASCKLWWTTEKRGVRDRHHLGKGHFRLGQHEGKLPKYLLDTPVYQA